MDKIIITNLRTKAIIGVNPIERIQPQEIVINLVGEVDCRPAGLSDDLVDAVNYAAVAQRVLEQVQTLQPYLVERLAEVIAGTLLAEFPFQRVTVRVEKPTIIPFVENVGVEISRP